MLRLLALLKLLSSLLFGLLRCTLDTAVVDRNPIVLIKRRLIDAALIVRH